MRKWVLRIHLYLGLLCSGYLILYGVSSLNFNHHFAFTDPGQQKVSWERTVSLSAPAPGVSPQDEAEAVRDALGLVGWTSPWASKRDSNGDLHFDLDRPGKHYTIHVVNAHHLVRAEEQRQGYWTVIRELHGLERVPGSRLASVWGIYTEICTYTVIFAAITGIYLFAARKRERRIGWSVLGAATALSILFMLYIRLRG